MTALNPAALAAAAALVLVGYAASKHPHPLKTGFASILSGVAALGAVNVLTPFTGVGLSLNGFTWFVSTLLGIPGVTLLLCLRLLFGME